MTDRPAPGIVATRLPGWATELVSLYESGSYSQFILHGNVQDRLLLPLAGTPRLGSLEEFLLEVLLPSYDVTLSYDVGNGLRVEKGGEVFGDWPYFKQNPQMPKSPRQAIEFLTHYFRYCANLGRLGKKRAHIGLIVRAAELVLPSQAGTANHDLNALALLVREWSGETLLGEHPLVTFLLVDNLNDLHPLLASSPRAAQVLIPLPSEPEIGTALAVLARDFPQALGALGDGTGAIAGQLRGATMHSVESLLRTREHARQSLQTADLSNLKRKLVEKDCHGLIEFVESHRSLDDLYGLESVKTWLRQDVVLWRQNDLEALPKGYLFCGPVGTGKTFLVECLAGEAGVPVIKLKNFRDRWVGSTEGNLETIFRLIQALGRCYVFVDEADQALGKRDAGAGDSGLSGRVYAMIAEEMGSARNRGRVIWVLASSRPDLIEVDLKRPGRIDVKVPLLPTASRSESLLLLAKLLARRDLAIPAEAHSEVESLMPVLLTPGAAEALAVKIYRTVRTASLAPLQALRSALEGYRHPVAPEVMRFQIEIAVQEASDPSFVPEAFRDLDALFRM
jgi:hypothetical protein